MAKFTTRVELHTATDEDYQILHSAMAKQGFTRTIDADDGTYHLPTAEYNRVGDLTRETVVQLAKTAASTTGKRYSVLVTEGTRQWYNLTPVKPTR